MALELLSDKYFFHRSNYCKKKSQLVAQKPHQHCKSSLPKTVKCFVKKPHILSNKLTYQTIKATPCNDLIPPSHLNAHRRKYVRAEGTNKAGNNQPLFF